MQYSVITHSYFKFQPLRNILKMKCVCSLCQSSFVHKSGLRKHQRNVHKIPMILRRKSNTADDFQCLLCLLTFTRKSNLKRHLLNIHKMSPNEIEQIVSNSAANCSKTTFRNLSTEATNEANNSHFSLNIFECAHCGDTFRRKKALIYHMKIRHLSIISDYKLLENILPDWPDKINVIIHYVVNKERQQFFSKFSISLKSKTEFNQWLSKFQDKNKITLRKRSVHPSVKPNLLYQVKFACHHHTKPRRGSVSRKHTKCPAYMLCKIFSNVNEANNYAEIRINHVHNHEFDSEDVLKFREPINEVKNKFRAMFSAGLTPAQALHKHRKDLEHQYASKFPKIVADRGICPNKSWVYYFKAVCQKTAETDKSLENADSCVSSSEESLISEDSSNIFQVFSDSKNSSSSEDSDNISIVRNNVILNVKTSTLQELTNLIRLSDQSVNLKVLYQPSRNVKYLSPETLSSQIFVKNRDSEELFNSEIVCEETRNTEIASHVSQPAETNGCIKEIDVFKEFDEMNAIIKKMAGQNVEIVEGLAQMVRNFRQNLNNAEALNIAVRNFGIS